MNNKQYLLEIDCCGYIVIMIVLTICLIALKYFGVL